MISGTAMSSLTVSAETATLRVSIEGGAYNSKFKFFDAIEGCQSYNDIPGAKHYLGGVFASDKGADHLLSVGQPVQVSLFRPKEALASRLQGVKEKYGDECYRWC